MIRRQRLRPALAPGFRACEHAPVLREFRAEGVSLEIDKRNARYVNDNLADFLIPVNADV
jgi:hypothetical protein